MAKGWGIHGWYMVELDEMPIEYIYTYIPNMGYDSDEMLKDDIIPLMVNDVWLISFIIIFCHI
jgi:hypothetical protein